jgi:hypothetical protein
VLSLLLLLKAKPSILALAADDDVDDGPQQGIEEGDRKTLGAAPDPKTNLTNQPTHTIHLAVSPRSDPKTTHPTKAQTTHPSNGPPPNIGHRRLGTVIQSWMPEPLPDAKVAAIIANADVEPNGKGAHRSPIP